MKKFKEYVTERNIIDKLMSTINRNVFDRKTYQLAFQELDKFVKENPRKIRGNLFGIAMDVARKYRDVDYRELATMFVDTYPQYAREIETEDSPFNYETGQFEQMQQPVIESDAPTNTTVGVANPDGPTFSKSRFAGYPCVEVDDATYMKCSQGKKPYARWKNYVEEEQLENFVKKEFNKEKKLLMKNKNTGAMSFIK